MWGPQYSFRKSIIWYGVIVAAKGPNSIIKWQNCFSLSLDNSWILGGILEFQRTHLVRKLVTRNFSSSIEFFFFKPPHRKGFLEELRKIQLIFALYFERSGHTKHEKFLAEGKQLACLISIACLFCRNMPTQMCPWTSPHLQFQEIS